LAKAKVAVEKVWTTENPGFLTQYEKVTDSSRLHGIQINKFPFSSSSKLLLVHQARKVPKEDAEAARRERKPPPLLLWI
jgi:hypothetical protein